MGALQARIARSLPAIPIPISGRKNRIACAICSAVNLGPFPSSIRTKFGALKIDPAHAPQRMLSYLFEHHLAYYSGSPLGQFIRTMTGGSTFVDVGANLGMYSLIAKSAGMKPVLFEPEPRHASFLAANANVFGDVRAVALSDSQGSLPFYLEDENSGAGSLCSETAAKPYCEVPLSIFSEEITAPVDLVKIDVEGAEERTVRGMIPYLTNGHRPAIWCEVRGNTGGRGSGSAFAITKHLEAFGYKAYRDDERAFDPDTAPSGVFDLYFEAGN